MAGRRARLVRAGRCGRRSRRPATGARSSVDQPGAAADAARRRRARRRATLIAQRRAWPRHVRRPRSARQCAQGFGARRGWPRSALGLLVGAVRAAAALAEPVVELVRPIPPLAFLPMFLVWFGLGRDVEGGLHRLHHVLSDVRRHRGQRAPRGRRCCCGRRRASARPARDLVRRVVLPAALPGIVVALRVGFGLALFVIVGAEFMGADAGLGHLIMEGRTFFNPAQIVMGALVLGAPGIAGQRAAARGRAPRCSRGTPRPERSRTHAASCSPLLVSPSLAGIAGDALAQGKPELTEIDAWLVRDPQMSSQFAVADQLGYFKAEGIKVNPRWYIAGTDLPSMWGAGNIHLGTATATMVVPIAASGQAIYSIAPQSDIAGTQQIVLGKKGQEIVRSPKDFEKLKIGMPKGASVTMAIQAMARDHGRRLHQDPVREPGAARLRDRARQGRHRRHGRRGRPGCSTP